MGGVGKGTLFGIVHDFLKIYLPKQRRLSPNTIRAYRKALEQLFDFIKERRKISLNDIIFQHLTTEAITAFLDYLEDERNCKTSTRNHRLAAIKAFIAYAAAVDISVAANMSELRKVPKKKYKAILPVDYMSETVISAILATPDISTGKGLRDCCLMVLMYDTGARVQEIVDIKLCDFRFGKTPTVTLNGKCSKLRTVPITDNTVNHVRKYISVFHPSETFSPERPLFYTTIHEKLNPLSDRRIRNIIKEYGKLARNTCIEVPENVYPHLFRHSRAMHLYQHGMDLTLVSQWLGHAHLETTQIYAYADTEHKRTAIANATTKDDPLFGKLNPSRYIVNDEEMLKRLYGLK